MEQILTVVKPLNRSHLRAMQNNRLIEVWQYTVQPQANPHLFQSECTENG